MAGTAPLSDAGTPSSNSLDHSLHSHNLPCNEELNCVVICSPAVYEQFKTLAYPHHFITANNVSKALGDLCPTGIYAWDTCPLRAVGRSSSLRPASSLGPHTFEAAAVEGDAEDLVEIATDDDTTGKVVAVPDFFLQCYTPEEV